MTPDKQPAPNPRPDGRPNRRRPVRHKQRGTRPAGEGGEPRSSESRSGEGRDAAASTGSQMLEKAQREQRERRERRRRRRLKAKQRDLTETRPETMTAEDLDLTPRPPVSIYTHVIRPAARDGYEFRSEHFSKVTRRLEDFHIDLSPLLRSEEEAAKQVRAELLEGLAEEIAEDAGQDELGEDDMDDDMDEDEAELPDAAGESGDNADEGDDL